MKILKQEIEDLNHQIQCLSHEEIRGKEMNSFALIKENVLKRQRQEKLNQLAEIKEDEILEKKYTTVRAYKELPHFFKFSLFKAKPVRTYFINQKGQKQIEPITTHIDFQGIKAEITYYGGELGDFDRMVFLAVMNEAFKNKDFIQKFGYIPFTLDVIADKAGISNMSNRRQKVNESLERLRLTSIKFKNSFGEFRFKGAFHLLSSVTSIEAKKIKSSLKKETKEGVIKKSSLQAQLILDGIHSKARKLTLVNFDKKLIEALLGKQVTTIDIFALQNLENARERTLFLYLYDIAQWRKKNYLLELSIQDVITLLDLKLHYIKEKYIQWNRTKNQIETIFCNVEKLAKFFISYRWEGEKENSKILINLDTNCIQIPKLLK